MSQQVIGLGNAPNDGTGDPARTAFQKCNNNFTDLYGQISAAVGVNALSVVTYGADPTGNIDSTTAFINAMNAAAATGAAVYVPSGNYILGSGITVPNGVSLVGAAMTPGVTPTGSVLNFGASVAICVTLTTGNNNTACLANLTVGRAGGTPPSGSVGILTFQSYNCQMVNVNSVNHDALYSFVAETTNGISAHLTNCYGSKAGTYYFKLDNWPELYVLGGRFGANGIGNYSATAFVYLYGDSSAGGGLGPNTVTFIGSHFNQGGTTCSYFWLHDNDIEPVGNQVEYKILGCHVEGISTAIFSSTASAPYFIRFNVASTVFANSSTPFFALNAVTQVAECIFSNNHIFSSTVSLSPTATLNFLTFTNNQCTGAVSFTGSAGSTAVLTGNQFRGGLTIAGTWAQLNLSGGNIPDGLYTNTATGNMLIDDVYVNRLISWVPTLSFTGSTGTNQYLQQTGWYQRKGNLVTAGFAITLSSFGTNVGSAYINASSGPQLNTGNPGTAGIVNYALNMTGLVGTVVSEVGTGPVINLYQYNSTGITNVTASNFTNTTTIRGWIQYVIAQV